MRILRYILFCSVFICLFSCKNGRRMQIVEPPIDTLSLIRNPAMGWGLYDDANDKVQDADTYWAAQDSIARAYASFFYVRWRWAELEPEEGRYAWLYDENYKKLIQGALDRGLKLAFRVYDNAQDNIAQATPEYVRKAGAKGYMVKGLKGKKLWTPYADDSVFQAKLQKFVEAFAEEYNDSERVVFVDGYNLGWWGECHHIELSGRQSLEQVCDWVTTLYNDNFTQVITLLPFGSEVGYQAEKQIAIDGKGFGMRRDGLGSQWFGDVEQAIAADRYGKNLLVGESCWWGNYKEGEEPWRNDTQYQLTSWRDVYELTCKQALENHFNTLDLREVIESERWVTLAEDKVWEFIRCGGYRLAPVSVAMPKSVKCDDKFTIRHEWQNFATGYMPNNHPQWGGRYRVAFAWLDSEDKVVAFEVDLRTDPADWLYGREYRCKTEAVLQGLPVGEYRVAIAIVDIKKSSAPAINLALSVPTTKEGWTILAEMQVEE